MHIGTVARLFRYPVKSMRGEALPATPVTLQGLPGDRRFAFVQAESQSPFPCSAREAERPAKVPSLLPGRVHGPGREPAPRVATPEGSEYDVRDPALRVELEHRFGRPLYLLQDHRGNYDVGQISLFSLATAAAIGEQAGLTVDPRRFRANLYVEPAETAAPEQDWVGRLLAIGPELRVAVTEPDRRCMMITLDPDTAAAQPSLLRTVVNSFGNCAGVYGSVVRPGRVQVGDALEIVA